MSGPSEQGEFGMLLSANNAHGEYIPPQGMLDAGLRVVNHHSGIRASEPALTFKQES
jgi:hypothetical protein